MNLDDRKLRDRDRRHPLGSRTGPDLRRRYERAMVLARGCETIGDKVEAERFYQQADHFRRLLNDQAA
jgi:hypothetical protein